MGSSAPGECAKLLVMWSAHEARAAGPVLPRRDQVLPASPRVRSVAPRVLQVVLPMTSAFLLLDPRVTLIDTGLPGSAGTILGALRGAGRDPAEVERIVITHYHPDHLGGLPELQRRLPARTAIHALEAPAAGALPGPPAPFSVAAARRLLWPAIQRACPFQPVQIDERLQDGDELPVLGGMRIVHTPGHTPGHVSLYFPDLEAADRGRCGHAQAWQAWRSIGLLLGRPARRPALRHEAGGAGC